jgi:hypothetical protein
MSGQEPSKPPAPTLPKKEEKKMTKAELTRRVNFVADVLRRVYANNRIDVTPVNLPITARGALQQQAVREYLRQPENRQLLNNIYSARERVTGGTAENVAIGINPILYPQIFIPIPPLGLARETPAELADIEERQFEAQERQEAEENIERITEILEEEEQQPAQFMRAGRIQGGPSPGARQEAEENIERITSIIEPELLEAEERARQARLRGVKKLQRGVKKLKPLKKRPPALEKAPETAKELEEARLRRLEEARLRRIEELERPITERRLELARLRRIEELERPIREKRLEQERQRARLEGKHSVRRRVVPVIRRPVVPQVERMEQRINQQNQNATGIVEPTTANVPADPEQQILQEAQQGQATLPALSNDQEVINAFTNEAPEAIRPSVRNLIQGNVDADTVTDDVLAYVLNKATGVPAEISKPYIKSLLDTFGLRVNKLIKDKKIPAEIVKLGEERTQAFRQMEEEIEMEREPEEIEFELDQAFESFEGFQRAEDLVDDFNAYVSQGQTDEVRAIKSRQYMQNLIARVLDTAETQNVQDSDTQRVLNSYVDVFNNALSDRGIPLINRFTEDQIGESVGILQTERQRERERARTARARQQAGQTGAVAGAGTGAGVVGIGEVAAGILGSSVGAGTAGLVGGGLAGAAAGMAAQRMGIGRKGQIGAGIAGGVLAGATVLAGRKGDIHVPGVSVREEPIAIPQQVVQQEEQNKGKGTVRPKFIIPSASILDQTESQIQADMDEFAAFDYVIPTSEGAKGNIKDNPLKQQAGVEYRLRFDGAGVDVTSLFGEPLRTSESELKQDFIGDTLDKLPRLEVGVMEKENLVGANIVSPYRWDSSVQVPGYRDPYRNYTRVTDLNNKINKSQLYGIQY